MVEFPKRLDWDHYFLKIAEDVANRATCNRLHCGVVVTDEFGHILLTDYNGVPAGEDHCPSDEDLSPEAHCPRALHAENNVIVQAANSSVILDSATWYLWPTGPCINCQRRFIIPTRAGRVVYPKNSLLQPDYVDTSALKRAGVVVTEV